MSLITIDREKCKQDGLCVAECPFGLIIENEDGGYPEIKAAAAKFCIRCGHCVSVCPHGALSLKGINTEDCTPIHKELSISAIEAEQFLKARRSIRTYKDEVIPHDTLAHLIETTQWAPSAKNKQPVNWLIIKKPAEVQKIAGLVVDWLRETDNYPAIVSAWDQGKDMVLRHAPHLAIAYASTGSLMPDVDCTIALTYLDMAANSMGIGTCWAGILMGAANAHQPLIDELGLPENHKVYGAMMLGYPKYKYFRIPQRNSAKIEWR